LELEGNSEGVRLKIPGRMKREVEGREFAEGELG
jgi:hypothetical protein